MWELLGGMGKSRVIATMAFMLIEQGYSKVHIVLPTVALMNRDQEEFNDYGTKVIMFKMLNITQTSTLK